jgi:hypothetical protein
MGVVDVIGSYWYSRVNLQNRTLLTRPLSALQLDVRLYPDGRAKRGTNEVFKVLLITSARWAKTTKNSSAW